MPEVETSRSQEAQTGSAARCRRALEAVRSFFTRLFSKRTENADAPWKPGPGNKSFVRQAAAASLTVVTAFLLITAGVLFAIALESAQDYQDDMLDESAGILARVNVAFSTDPPALEVLTMDDDDFEAAYELPTNDPRSVLDAGEQLLILTLHKSGRAIQAKLDAPLRTGISDLRVGGDDYRVRFLSLSTGSRIVVGERKSEVLEAAAAETLRAIVPIVIVALLFCVLLALLLWRLAAPVRAITTEVKRRSGEALAPLDTTKTPTEILPLVVALNDLFARVDELRRQEARFVADAAHELRSPLTALSLQAERMTHDDMNEAAREKLEKLRTGIARASSQVSQLLALKRAQAGVGADASPTQDEADLREVLGRAVEDVWEEMAAKNIELEVLGLEDDEDEESEAPRPLVFPMPADDLFTVLRNLLENAVRYSPAGTPEAPSRIEVIARQSDSGAALSLTVADSGPGIADQEKPRVFDPFYRVLGTGVSGTGLGLAIVKTLCRKHGLTVTLADAKPDAPAGRRGAAFTIAPENSAKR